MAGWLLKYLGYGKFGLVDTDAPDSPPSMSAVQSGVWSSALDRPSSKTGRTYKQGAVSNVSSNQILYSVTPGKTLYVQSIVINGFNANVSTSGVLEIRDGTTTVRLPVVIPPAGVGATFANMPIGSNNHNFLEPLQFNLDFRLAVVQGTLTFSCSFIGYEE